MRIKELVRHQKQIVLLSQKPVALRNQRLIVLQNQRQIVLRNQRLIVLQNQAIKKGNFREERIKKLFIKLQNFEFILN